MTNEIQEMLHAFKGFGGRSFSELSKHYFTPEIPDEILEKLVKHYDNHLPVNSIIAFYDTSLFGSCKSGLLFTNDGFYHRIIGKPVYIRYADIEELRMIGDKELRLQLKSDEMPGYDFQDNFFNVSVFKELLQQLIGIDTEHGQSSVTETGKVKKLNIPKEKLDACHTVIHTASVACGGVGTGMAQIPLSDTAVIMPIQVTMIIALGKVFDIRLDEGAAKGILASAGASIVGRGISQVLVGWIPGLGNAINTATAAGVTEVIGWIAVRHLYDCWIEDRNKGRFEGMKDGYIEASGEYERKLQQQAEEFLKQIKDFEHEHDEYERLLDEYEAYIAELESNQASPYQVEEVKGVYQQLKQLRSA